MKSKTYNVKRNPEFINLKKYPVRTSKENTLIRKDPFGDRDKDKVPNMMDCKPLDKKQQGFGGLLGGLLALAITAEVAGSLMHGADKRRVNYNKKSKNSKNTWGY